VRVGSTTLDFADADSFDTQHDAFQVTEDELDPILARIKDEGWPSTPTPATSAKASSTTGTAGAACTSQTPTTATTSSG
jgi:hypothetical protein